MKPRAVTGLGVASTLGVCDADAFFARMPSLVRLARESVAPPTSFDPTKYGAIQVVEVPSFDPTKHLGDKGLRTLDRLTKLLIVAARICLQDAGFKKDGQWVVESPDTVGLCCSNAYGSLEAITELDRVAKLEDARYINPAKFPNTVSNSASGYVSIWEDLRAMNVSISDGNCGGLDAANCTDIFLATGRANAIVTGGGEAMSEPLFLAFQKLGALGDTWLGEGAALLAVEDLDHARRRGARVHAEIVGYGTSFVAPRDDASVVFTSSEAIARAIRSALTDAGLAAADVSLVASSLSGIAYFDEEELAALDAVVPLAPVAAPKLAFGETLGAGGALAMAAAVAWLAGTPLGTTPMVRGTLNKPVEHVLVVSTGYHGNASAVVMTRAKA